MRKYTVVGRALNVNGKRRKVGDTLMMGEKNGDILARSGRLEAVRDTERAPLVEGPTATAEVVPAKPKRKAKSAK